MTKTAMTYRWDDLPTERPMDLVTRRRVTGERCMLSHVTLEKGFTVGAHRHENEQCAVVLSGRMRFTLGEGADERIVELGAGEVVLLPPDVLHGAEALEESVVLDVFSPPSETTGIDHED